MKYGYELEFQCPIFEERWIRLAITKMGEAFSLCYDHSASGKGMIGLEAITGICSEFPLETFSELINLLKRYNCQISRTCGFHIHFSGAGDTFSPYIFREKISKIGYHLSREPWVNNAWVDKKYHILNHIEKDHYECRIFNGTMNLRALVNYQRKLDEAIEAACHG